MLSRSLCRFKSLTLETKNVLVTRKIPKIGQDILKNAGFLEIDSWDREEKMPYVEILKSIKTKKYNGILCLLTDQIDDNLIKQSPALEVISTFSVGHNHIDLESCKQHNVRVGYTPGVLTNAAAEHAVALLLAVARRLPEGNFEVSNGGWGAWKPEWMLGKDVMGSTIGIVGMGRIGEQFGRIMKNGFNCNVIYSDVHVKEGIDWAKHVPFDFLLEISDFVVPHCTLNESTRELFGKTQFRKMKKDAIFINTTRGGIVNQEDLYSALVSGDILSAGLDVTIPEPIPIDHDLLSLKNCFIVPHMASATIETRDEMARVSATNLVNALKGKEMISELEF